MNSTVPIEAPVVSVTEISDPTSVGAGVELIDIDAVQLDSQPLQARRVVVRLGAVSLIFHETNRRLRTQTSVQGGFVTYVTFGPQARGTVNGTPVRPGMMLAVAPETEVRLVVEPGYESIALLLPPEELATCWSARGWEGAFPLPRGVERLQADEALVRGLFEWGRRLVETAVAEPALFNGRPEGRAAAQVELIETLLATLCQAGGLPPSRDDRTRGSRSEIVHRAERHALAHSSENLYVSDLCRAAGVSERTLEYAFKEIMGLTPMAYLIRLRLHRVRKALLAARPETTTVSAQALTWGFWHFGEFSKAYRECFGESPSDTLRQIAL
jgi:AraC family ethanolamine operon transcriptional activator